MPRTTLSSILATTLVLAAACSEGTVTAPTASGAQNGAGAVIDGRVTSATGSTTATAIAAVSPLAGLTVRIAGTDRATSVSTDGTFRLVEVPVGPVRLEFSSAQVNAAATLTAIGPNEVVEVVVRISSTSAEVLAETRAGQVALCHAEGNGSYHLITIDASAEPAHRAHGDAEVGEPVPGRPGDTFDASCRPEGPRIQIEKATNGDDADAAPGPQIAVGAAVSWTYVVVNTGIVTLTSIVVADDRGESVSCPGTTLAPADSMTCTAGGTATLGQYRNVGSATAAWTRDALSGTVEASDASHYLGVDPDEETGPKVTLCHRTGNDRYVEISVSVNAEPAHRTHGDGKIGEAVPGQAGRTFGSGCRVQ